MLTLIRSASVVETASAVFIDVPNVASNRRNWHHAFKWERLSQSISRSEVLMGTQLMHSGSYVRGYHDTDPLTNWAKTAFKTFGRSSFEMKVRWIDDVDSMIIGDMWKVVAQREQEILAQQGDGIPFTMRFVLVSGDSDYANTANDIRKTYGSKLNLELYVYSWIDALSELLRTQAVWFTSLDSIPGFVRDESLLRRA